MKPEEIKYTTNIIEPYNRAIRECDTKADLIELLQSEWAELCPDALEQASNLPDNDTWLWVKKHAGRSRNAKRIIKLAGAILMPKILCKIGLLAAIYYVPDGCCFIRMIDMNQP